MKDIALNAQTVAIITGAASGMGEQCALQLAEHGVRLVLLDLSDEGLSRAAGLIRSKNQDAQVETHAVDVTNTASLERVRENIAAQFGHSNILINCAGSSMLGSFDEISLEEFEWLMNINLWGTVKPSKVFLPLLLAGRDLGGSHISNLSSAYALVAPAGRVPYATSKFAVRGFTESLRHELARSFISVSAVHPGGISTGLVARARVAKTADTEVIERVTKAQLAEYGTTPERAAQAIILGVIKRKKRVIIGNDARGLDFLSRITPAHHWRLLQRRLAAATETPPL